MKTPEKDKFLAWFKSEKDNGLIDMKLTPTPFYSGGCTEEEAYAELNRMNEAPDLPFPEGF